MDEAKAAFEKAAELDPTKAGDYLFNEGAMYNNNQDYPKAIEAFKKTLAADPNNKGGHAPDCDFVFRNPGNHATGGAILKKFLTLNPTPQDAETAKLPRGDSHDPPTEFKSERRSPMRRRRHATLLLRQKPAKTQRTAHGELADKD